MALAVALGMASPAAPAADWFEVDMGDYRIISNVGQKTTAGVVRNVQVYEAALDLLLRNNRRSSQIPITLFLLSGLDFNRLAAPYSGLAGLADQSDEQITLLANGEQWQQASQIVFHELTHVMLHREYTGKALPVWFDEGCAEYLSTIEYHKNRIEIGRPPVGRWRDTQELDWLPLDTVLRTSRASKEYRSGGLAQAFYAQSWLLVHANFMSPEHMSRLGGYLNALSGGLNHTDAFAVAFPNDKGEFEREMRRYREQKKLKYLKFDAPADVAGRTYDVKAIAESAARLEFAHWMVWRKKPKPEQVEYIQKLATSIAPGPRSSLQLALATARANDVDADKTVFNQYCNERTANFDELMLCGVLVDEFDQENSLEVMNGYFSKAMHARPDNLSALIYSARTAEPTSPAANEVRQRLEASYSKDRLNPTVNYQLARLYRPIDLAKSRDYLEKAMLTTFDPDAVRGLIRDLEQIEHEQESTKAGSNARTQ